MKLLVKHTKTGKQIGRRAYFSANVAFLHGLSSVRTLSQVGIVVGTLVNRAGAAVLE
jgi:inosine/xanthosine triphosphate pyrophosphatase family protein